MKSSLVILFTLVLTLGAALAQTTCTDDALVIVDPALEAAMKNSLNVDSIDCEALASLNQLNARGEGITSLEGLEYAYNLKRLNLDNNQISDLTPLQGLPLEQLTLGANALDDGSLLAVRALPALKDLRVNGNKLSSTTTLLALTSLTNLETLFIHSNRFESLQPLPLFLGLKHIAIGNNPLAEGELERLTQMPNLTRFDLTSLPLSDGSEVLSLFANPGQVTLLNLSNTQIDDLDFLAELTSLEQLYLRNSPAEDFGVITRLNGLERLELRGTSFKDINLLSELANLSWLSLRDNPIDDISGLEDALGLQEGATLLLQETCVIEDDASLEVLSQRGVRIVHSTKEDCS